VSPAPAAVHQLLPCLAPHDAIGTHVLALQGVIRSLGLRSEVFAGEVRQEMAGLGRPFEELATPLARAARRLGGRTWFLYHASIGCPIADWLVDEAAPTLVCYHNITPGELLDGWSDGAAREVRWGRHQLARLARHARAGLAVSELNRRELEAAGFETTATVPLLVDPVVLDGSEVDAAALARLRSARAAGGGTELLFVGKLSRHKAQHVLVEALAAFRRLYDPTATLRLVGTPLSASYADALRKLAGALGVADGVELAGALTRAELGAYLANADVLLCASEHEGFCVPLLEAMARGLPVVARGAAAVPETLGDAGVVLAPDASPLELAAAAWRVVSDRALSDRLAEAGRRRAARFRPEQVAEEWRRALGLLLGSARAAS
jgi:glycosyltransferase involved in cell wall biosynthesis